MGLKFLLNRKSFIVGSIVLLLGALFYFFGRHPEQTYFLTKIGFDDRPYNFLTNNFIPFSQNFPSFIHPFSFILLSAGLIPHSKRNYFFICLFWFLVNIVFELGQQFNTTILKVIPSWFLQVAFFDNTKTYFLNGTFDLYDLFAIASGTIAAHFFLLTTLGRSIK